MSTHPDLPPKLLDLVVDLLHDTEDALRKCCLVSKSWISRTRKHLFADVKFRTKENLRSWRKTFPDPSTSPAHYANTLLVGCPHVVTAADAEEGGWISGFSRVVHLEVDSRRLLINNSTISYVRFHGFSPTIKSLRLAFEVAPSSQAINLILSFPLLEDLTVVANDGVSTNNSDNSDELSTIVQPSSSPVFTGSLALFLRGEMGPIIRRLLSLPGDIHFRKLNLTWFREEDVF